MPTIRSALVVTAVVFSISTGAYFAFGDDLTRLIGRQTRMEITPYNDQIAELRAKVDRTRGQFLGQRRAEDSFTTGTTKLEGIAPLKAMPAETKVDPKPSMQLATLDPDTRLRDEVPSACVEGLHHVRQLADALDASAVASRDQRSRARPAQQQHTGRDRAGSNAVQCRRADDESICQDRVWRTIREPRPAVISACSNFLTGNLPNTGRATTHPRLLNCSGQKVCRLRRRSSRRYRRPGHRRRTLLHPPARLSRLCVSLCRAAPVGMEEYVPNF